MALDIYVISNSGLFREALNAIAAFCHSDGFRVVTHIGGVLGIVLTLVAYIQKHNPLLFLKWLVMYLVIFNVMLGVPETVAVINTSDQSIPPLVVDNVPLGIALPAHFITTIGYGIAADLETAFSMPQELQYSQTGMLFGSNLFRLSLASNIDDPTLMNEVNGYVRSCVVGDILINHKYTFNDLLHSKDMWALMTSNPSQIRGMFINGEFNTCKQAATQLTKQINDYSTNKAPGILAKFIPSHHDYAPAAINTLLTTSYQYFKAQSQSASDILRQNIAINAFRAGIKNYAAEAGSVASIANVANTTAMENTRMAWATSRHIGIETLPMMQVVLLVLVISLFPLIIVLALIPGLGLNVLRQYLASILWLESWPLMFAVLNMAMNFYLSAGQSDPVTLSNINRLAQEHSDIAGVAGYLVLAIPFLSFGLVKGMAFVFNNAAQYLGGMMHSIAQGSAASGVMGNYSLGNVSTNNATANMLSANKHDTNFTDMHGMSTQQLGNAATLTSTPMGGGIYHTGSGMSQLATGENIAQSTVSSLSHQVDSSLSSAFSHNTQFVKSMAHNHSMGISTTSGISAQVDNAMSTIHNLSHGLAQREGISDSDAFKRMSEVSSSASGSLGGSFGLDLGGNGATIEGRASLTATGRSISSHEGTHSTGLDHNITANEARDFRQAMQTVQNYAHSHSLSNQNSDSQNLAIQMGSDLSHAERLSSSAQFIESHSEAINTNFSQAFANYVQANYPSDANAILSATGDSPLLAKQEQLAEQFVASHAEQLSSQYAANSNAVQQEPSSSKYMMQNYQQHAGQIQQAGSGIATGASDGYGYESSVINKIHESQAHVESSRQTQQEQVNNLRDKSQAQMQKGKEYAARGVTSHIIKGIEDL